MASAMKWKKKYVQPSEIGMALATSANIVSVVKDAKVKVKTSKRSTSHFPSTNSTISDLKALKVKIAEIEDKMASLEKHGNKKRSAYRLLQKNLSKVKSKFKNLEIHLRNSEIHSHKSTKIIEKKPALKKNGEPRKEKVIRKNPEIQAEKCIAALAKYSYRSEIMGVRVAGELVARELAGQDQAHLATYLNQLAIENPSRAKAVQALIQLHGDKISSSSSSTSIVGKEVDN